MGKLESCNKYLGDVQYLRQKGQSRAVKEASRYEDLGALAKFMTRVALKLQADTEEAEVAIPRNMQLNEQPNIPQVKIICCLLEVFELLIYHMQRSRIRPGDERDSEKSRNRPPEDVSA
jgi:hypothetical protein